jgi:beta-lactamase class D
MKRVISNKNLIVSIASVIVILFLQACTRNNIKEQTQWKSIFDKYHIDSIGVELADNSHEQVYYYNLNRLSTRYSPASTFKIVNSLIGLETNVANDEDFIIRWDGKVHEREEWNKDMSMREAFKVSCVPYYQELARRIGMIDMKQWIDSIKYGNKQTGSVVDNFWLNDTLQISPDEQVGFMKKLYFDKLPFSQRSMRIVRSMMLQEDSTNYKLYYKTGTNTNQQLTSAWLVGFIEKKEEQIGVLTKKKETNYKPYFFALHMETRDTMMNTKQVRLAIMKEILREKKIIQ